MAAAHFLTKYGIHNSWEEFFEFVLTQDYFKRIANVLQGDNFYPDRSNIFKVFSMPEESINCIIIGQDPYPTKGYANGIAFSHSNTFKKSPSLQVFERLTGELDSTLQHWIDQGVFLLNASLTTGINKESHAEYWLPFMNDLFAYLAKYKDDMVIVRMGKVAQNIIIDKDRFTVLDTVHPMADTYGDKDLFKQSDVFNHINKINFVISKHSVLWQYTILQD